MGDRCFYVGASRQQWRLGIITLLAAIGLAFLPFEESL